MSYDPYLMALSEDLKNLTNGKYSHGAFDALLDVAKAATFEGPDHAEVNWRRLEDAIAALDAAHPDWREW